MTVQSHDLTPGVELRAVSVLLDNDGSESQLEMEGGAQGSNSMAPVMVLRGGGAQGTGDFPAMVGQSCDLRPGVWYRTVAALVPYIVWYYFREWDKSASVAPKRKSLHSNNSEPKL